jgi:hypothetical protein
VKRFAGSPLQATLGAMVRPGLSIARSRTQLAVTGAVLLTLMVAAGAAWPQAAPSPPPASPSAPPSGMQPPVPQQTPDQPAAPQPVAPQGESPAPAAPAAPPPADSPGLLHEMGKLFDKSLSILPPIKSPGETIDDFNARAKDAGETLSRLAKPLMVTGRMICPVSANGAPDCKAASDKLCQTKGFKEGKSLTTDSAETCSAKVLIPGRKRKPDDCRTDNYVTRALCQ